MKISSKLAFLIIRKRLVFSIIISLTSFTLHAQLTADQLEFYKKMSQSKDDSLAYEGFFNLAYRYRVTNYDSSIFYLGKFKELIDSRFKEDFRRRGIFHETKGSLHNEYYDFSEANKEFKKALNLYIEIGDDEKIANTLINLGNINSNLSEFDSALRYFNRAEEAFNDLETMDSISYASLQLGIAVTKSNIGMKQEGLQKMYKALEIFELLRDTVEITRILNNIGIMLIDLEDYESAESNVKTALRLAKTINDQYAKGLSNSLLGDIALRQKKNLKAIDFYENALEINEGIGNENEIFDIRIHLCDVYMELEQWKDALDILLLNEELLDQIYDENNHFKVQHFTTVGRLHAEIGNQTEAVNYLKLAESTSIPKTLPVAERLNVWKDFHDLYKALGDYENSYRYYVLRDKLNDSTFTTETKRNILELETKYETAKKEQEIASLQQVAEIQSLKLNSYLIGGGSLLLLLIGGGILYYRQYKTKRDKASLELEQRFLRSQLNPHFIFNSMGAIQQYLLTESPEKASDYMSVFSRLMRQILENSREEFITLEEEISMLKNYLELQKLRFNSAFSYTITIDENLDPAYDGIPPMFAQPFIENTLEHGLFKKDKNELIIKFSKTVDNHIQLEIVDTGIGITQAIGKANDHTSLATKITNERLEKMRITYKAELSLNTENITSEAGEIEGYRVRLSLPSKMVAA